MKIEFEKRNLKIKIDEDLFGELFEDSLSSLMFEVEMIIDGLNNDVEKFIEFVNDDENGYVVYLNKVKYEFDY